MDPLLREAGPVLAGSGTREAGSGIGSCRKRAAGSGQRDPFLLEAGGAGGIPSGSVMSQVSAIGRPMVSAS
jgi:hypothetical protein